MTSRPAAALALVAVVAVGCGGDPAVTTSPVPASPSLAATSPGTPSPGTVAPSPTPTPTSVPATGCAAPEMPPLQSGGHLIGDAEPPVPYSSVPPTSGWHASGRPQPGVHRDPLTEPQLVSLLEGGGVVAAYDPTGLPTEQVARLEGLAEASGDRLSVIPYEVEMPTPLALTAWGVLQRCDGVDEGVVAAFVEEHYGQTGDDGH